MVIETGLHYEIIEMIWALMTDINIRTHDIATLGLWGPQAQNALGHFIDPNQIAIENFPFCCCKESNSKFI